MKQVLIARKEEETKTDTYRGKRRGKRGSQRYGELARRRQMAKGQSEEIYRYGCASRHEAVNTNKQDVGKK